MSDNTLNEILRDHAMLVSVHIKHWSAASKDNAAAKAAAEASGAAGAGAFKAMKNLMFKHDDRLKKVQKAANELRAAHNDMTMAWDAGRSPFRMLATIDFEPYMKRMGKLKAAYDAALKDFLDNYLEDKAGAMRALNIENDPQAHRLYPSEAQVTTKFGVEIMFEPIPAGRQFRNLPDTAVAALAAKHEQRVTDRFETAIQSSCDTMAEQLAHLREMLSVECEDGRSQRWRDSSVYSISDTARVLANFDFSEDKKLKEFCGVVAGYFGSFSKTALSKLRKPESADDRLTVRDRIAQFETELETFIESRKADNQ